MISLKEIENRKYNDTTKEPIYFEYTIKGLQGSQGEEEELRVWFERVQPEVYGIQTNFPTYKIFTIIRGTVCEQIYSMPKKGMTLEMVVATGLNLLRMVFQEEASYKEMLSYTISDIVKDM